MAWTQIFPVVFYLLIKTSQMSDLHQSIKYKSVLNCTVIAVLLPRFLSIRFLHSCDTGCVF